MSYQTMLDDFTTILDRADMSVAQAQIFLAQGMTRVQRDCRLPSMERALLVTPSTSAMNQFAVPADLIQIIDVLVPKENSSTGQMRALQKVAYRRLLQMDNTDLPKAYARFQGQIYIAGGVPIGNTVQFLYYGGFTPFVNATDENELSSNAPDLGVYAALRYAGDFYEHPLTATWEATYQSLKAAVIAMAIDLENEGGVNEIEPIYHDED